MIGLVQGAAARMPLAAASVHQIVCSPPYYGKIEFTDGGDLGLEPLHDCNGWATGRNCGACYVCRLRTFAAEAWRVLRDDGTFWVNLGDSYISDHPGGRPGADADGYVRRNRSGRRRASSPTLKPKDLAGIPARVALAFQADGWWWRQRLPWVKANAMTDSAGDRPGQSLEEVLIFAKRHSYYFDMIAARETLGISRNWRNGDGLLLLDVPTMPFDGQRLVADFYRDGQAYIANPACPLHGPMAQARKFLALGTGRDVPRTPARAARPGQLPLDIFTEDCCCSPAGLDHFATWPPGLVETMIRAGTSDGGCCRACGAPFQRRVQSEFIPQPDIRDTTKLRRSRPESLAGWGGSQRGRLQIETLGFEPGCDCDAAAPPAPCLVLDPFVGTGTTGEVARDLRRDFVGLDLSHVYLRYQAFPRLGLDKSWKTVKQSNDVDS